MTNTDAILAQLDAGMTPGIRLALLVAPAGWGKTPLLRRWSAQNCSPVAWMTMLPGDNDGACFLSDLYRALQDIGLPASAPVGASMERNEPRICDLQEAPNGLEDEMTELINALTHVPAAWALVLDEYQQVCNDAIHAAVALLLDYPPPGLHLYLACRVTPPLPLARWRVRRQMVEICLSRG